MEPALYNFPLHNRLLRSILRPAFRALFHILSSVHITGLENVPQSGAYLVAPNHVSMFEPPFIMAFWPVALEAAGAAQIWSTRGQSTLARAYSAFPVRRGQYDRKLLDAMVNVLKSGNPLLIFPEGGRSHKPGMQRALAGVAYLAGLTQAPVVPVGVIGSTVDFFDRALRGKRPRIEMRIGEPVCLPPLEGRGNTHRAARQRNSDQVMVCIAALVPPEYRGDYAQGIPTDDPTGQNSAKANQ